MKIADLRLMNAGEWDVEIEKCKRELLNLRCRIALGEDVKSSDVKTARRDIARILTLQKEHESAAAQTDQAASEQG